jgi:hypothetical protein
MEEQIATIYIGTRGYVDSLDIEQVIFFDKLLKQLKDTNLSSKKFYLLERHSPSKQQSF